MTSHILNDAFFASLDSSIGDVNEAQMLPPACYVSEEVFEFEKSAIFDHEWLCVGRESWAANPGDFFTSTHINEPIVVTRGRDGVLRAFSNVCQHRAMLVAEGHGNARSLLCQYHHWAYGLDGKLIGAPAMEQAKGFDKDKICLPQFKLETWLGFVFVNFDNNAAPLSPRLKPLADALERYEIGVAEGAMPDAPTRFPWNWKVMMENNNDGYHATKLHAGPLHDIIPSHLSTFPDVPEDCAGYYRLSGAKIKDPAFNPTHRSLMPVFPRLIDEDRHRLVFANVPPTLSLIVLPDQVTYMILHANSANELSMTRGWLVAPGAMQQPLFAERMAIGQQAARGIVLQDLHVDELIPIGMRSRFATRGRFSWQEGAQLALNRWLVQRYKRGWQALKKAS